MRIISGRFKGMAIEAPRGLLSRPPLAIIRESVFNVLGLSGDGTRVLDLFAGSGSFGIEAISRGAGSVHFVDSARRCVQMIDRNLHKVGAFDRCRITRREAVDFIRQWQGDSFDLVFVDPPFLSGQTEEVLRFLPESPVTVDGTLVVARVHRREQMAPIAGLVNLKTRRFGESVVHFLKVGRGE
jgi:16S rRNA (guanine966-N2)-methyltransferase